jgi:heterodisulfide reductase subunit A
VVTLADFIEWLSEQPEGATPTFNDKPVRAVGFIHCVGSRQMEGVNTPGSNGRINEYCSRVCCTATLHAVCDLRARFPGVSAYELYQDIRAYGRGHEEYYERASKADVIFLRYDGAQPPKVSETDGDDFPITVSCIDGLTWGEEVEVGVDMVVLAVGMTPASVGGLATSLKLPASADGFLQEVHPKLRPVEQSVSGVLLAGTCQAPKDVTESCASASAAAGKAFALLASGKVQLDPYVAHVDANRCAGHAACVEECPCPSAIAMQEYPDGTRRAIVNPALCTGCGACVAVCPTAAIDLSGWSLDAYEAMVDALLASPSEVPAR